MIGDKNLLKHRKSLLKNAEFISAFFYFLNMKIGNPKKSICLQAIINTYQKQLSGYICLNVS